MFISEIQALQSTASMQSQQSIGSITEMDRTDFLNLINEKISQVDEKIKAGDKVFENYILGKDISVHEVMLAMGKAKSELQLIVEVRNKILEAYQEITRIQL